MKYMNYRLYGIASLLLVGMFYLSSCSPVNRLTQVKKTPRLYSVNYNYPNVIANRSEINKKAWVVYSDRAGNVATKVPGGKLVNKELAFMEPMLVIRRKGDYLRVIKYSQANLKDFLGRERLTKYKEAEYYGWIHKDNVLLFNNATTEVRNGLYLKSLAGITDTAAVFRPAAFLGADSVKMYKQPALEDAAGKLAIDQVVYVFKKAENDTKLLVAPKNALIPKDAQKIVCGWVDASMVAPLGQRLTFDNGMLLGGSPLNFAPVLFADLNDSTMMFRSLVQRPIVDKSANRVLNVDGRQITYAESYAIRQELHRINMIFAFDMTDNVIKQMPMLTNAIQNLKPTFDSIPSSFRFRFGAVVGDYTISLNPDYSTFTDRLTTIGEEAAQHKGVSGTVLQAALKLAAEDPAATNIIVLAGERTSDDETPKAKTVQGFIDNNCRLLSFQVYSDTYNAYNNFVLQSTGIIDGYADAILRSKRAWITYSDQLRTENLFRESSKNAYSLDFPAHSMTQGMVLFAEKKQMQPVDNLAAAVDSLTRAVVADNTTVSESLKKAFLNLGDHLDRFDSVFASRFNLDPLGKPGQGLKQAIPKTEPEWVSITPRQQTPIDTVMLKGVSLLLTEGELTDLKDFMKRLASKQVDIKNQGRSQGAGTRKVRRVVRDLKGVPSDAQLDDAPSNIAQDSIKKYMPTGKIRRSLMKVYLSELKNCNTYTNNRKLTLARAQQYITTCPTLNPTLTGMRVKDLRRRRVLSDAQLDELVRYYKGRKEQIEKSAKPANELNTPTGEKYYLLPAKSMP